tara:strand:- start:43826 stop:44047 length:222 start_codon:yes stop_codon:yes gene_type:complete
MADRYEMLKEYLKNELLIEMTELEKKELEEVNYSTSSNDPLIEALKRMIFSYCQGDAKISVLRNVNIEIEKNL